MVSTLLSRDPNGALLGVSCDSRQRPFLGDSTVLKSRRTTVKKGEKTTATLFYLFSTATALYFKNRQRRWHRDRRLRHSVYSSFCNGASVNSRYPCRIFFSQYFLNAFCCSLLILISYYKMIIGNETDIVDIQETCCPRDCAIRAKF
jgi:hypothetical protein